MLFVSIIKVTNFIQIKTVINLTQSETSMDSIYLLINKIFNFIILLFLISVYWLHALLYFYVYMFYFTFGQLYQLLILILIILIYVLET